MHTDTFTIDNNNFECSPIVIFPTAFSPNGDGKNDVFHAVYSPGIEHFHMRVFDRWGVMVYESYSYTDGWDGKYKNIPQPIGTYIWFIDYTYTTDKTTQTQTGNITLLR
jgi:gliding motility-associated-like protein